MNQYKIKGTSRQVNAIGIPEYFELSIQAMTREDAIQGARESQYDEGRELVHVESCEYDRIESCPMYFNPSNIRDTDELKRAVKETGSHYFDPSTMRFFRSRLSPFIMPCNKGVLFITSEQFVHYDPYYKESRMYTVRLFTKQGKIDDVGKFQEFSTLNKAKARAKQFSNENPL